jgi:hypothetical protein
VIGVGRRIESLSVPLAQIRRYPRCSEPPVVHGPAALDDAREQPAGCEVEDPAGAHDLGVSVPSARHGSIMRLAAFKELRHAPWH